MKVLISGAGIAGLSLALRLRQRGLAPIVVERSPRLRDGGYMLGLADPGLDAAERMGVADALRAARHMPRRLVYIGPTGRERFAMGGAAVERLVGERQFNLLRGDIKRVLHERVRDDVEVRFGASVASVQEMRDGVAVRLGDGAEVGCDLVVGADGLHSRARALRFGPEERFVRPLGARVATFLLGRSAISDAQPGTSYSLTEVGRAAALAPVDERRLVAFLIWRTEGRPRLATAEEELHRSFTGAGWHVPARLDRLSRTEDVYFDEAAQVVMPRWSAGRVALLGDAASAVSLEDGGRRRAASAALPSGRKPRPPRVWRASPATGAIPPTTRCPARHRAARASAPDPRTMHDGAQRRTRPGTTRRRLRRRRCGEGTARFTPRPELAGAGARPVRVPASARGATSGHPVDHAPSVRRDTRRRGDALPRCAAYAPKRTRRPMWEEEGGQAERGPDRGFAPWPAHGLRLTSRPPDACGVLAPTRALALRAPPRAVACPVGQAATAARREARIPARRAGTMRGVPAQRARPCVG